MSRCVWVSISLCTVLMASCGKPPTPPSTPVVPAVPVRKYGDPIDWVNDPPIKSTMTFAELDVRSTTVRNALLRWQAAARGMRKTDWFYQPWYSQPKKSGVFLTWWSTMPEHVNESGQVETGHAYATEASQNVLITCVSGRNGLRRSEYAFLHATSSPTDGWGVAFSVMIDPAGLQLSRLLFYPHGAPFDDKLQNIALFPDFLTWHQSVKFGGVDYTVRDAVGPAVDADSLRAALSPDLIAKWTSSAESFQQATLDTLDELERKLRNEIASGVVAKSATQWVPAGGTHGGDPDRLDPHSSDRPLSPEEQQSMLDDGLKEIERRRGEIIKHSVELHAALLKVFLMSEVVGPAGK
jgi:hypothetical protein